MSQAAHRPPGWKIVSLTGFGLWMMACALVSLWTLDVLVNLDLPGRWITGRPFYCTLEDFGALFAGELQIAAASVLLASILGPLVTLLARRPRVARDARLAMLRAGALLLPLPLFLAQSRIAWDVAPNQLARAAGLTLLPAGLLWLVVSFQANPRSGGVARATWAWLFLPGWGVASLNLAAASLFGGDLPQAAAGAGAAITAAGLWLACRHGTGRLQVLAAFPIALALLMAGIHVVAFDRYGQDGTADVELDAPLSAAPGAGQRPNIVLIVLDTVRADRLERYGHHRDTMPALERWAADAVVFTRAVSPAGWTAPAHASIFSGRTVSQHGIHHGSTSGGGGEVYATRARAGTAWLPDLLAQAGYYCVAVTANPVALPPDITGFHRVFRPRHEGWYDGTVAALTDAHSPVTRRLSERLRWRLPYVDAKGIASVAIRAAQPRDRPVFLFVNFVDAHSPYDPPESALEAIGAHAQPAFPRYLPHTALTLFWPGLPPSKQAYLDDLYDGELRWIDTHVARLLEALEGTFGPRTVFIVTSDHGEDLGEDGRVGHEYGLAQHMVHVPLFAKGPGIGPRTIDTAISTRRLFDFILDAARTGTPHLETLSKPDPLHLVAERYPYHDSIRLFGRAYDRPWVVMFRNGYKGEGPGNQGFRLLDVVSKGFTRELEADDAGMAALLRQDIDRYWEAQRDRRGLETVQTDEDTLDMLKQLGYVNE